MGQAHLEAINQDSHDEVVARVRQALSELQAANKRISFYSVAEKAQVARSTLYRCNDLRRLIETARSERTSPSDIPTHPASSEEPFAQIAELTRMLMDERERSARLERTLQDLQPCRYATITWKGVA